MKKLVLLLSIVILLGVSASAQDTLVTFKFKVANDSSQTFGNTYNVDDIVLREAIFNHSYSYSSGADGNVPLDYSLSSNHWTSGLDSSKCYYTSFASTAYTTILVSSRQKSSPTGPKDFKLQYKVGASGTWTDVTGGTVTCADDNFVSGVLTNVSLPSTCDNQPLVYLRWVMTSNTSVNVGTVAWAGTSRIDNIFILGTSIYVGIASADLNEAVTIYPNPSSGNFTVINSTESLVSIEVMDLVGKIVMTSQSKEKNIRLDMESANKGIYFVQITNQAGNKIVRKLVIK